MFDKKLCISQKLYMSSMFPFNSPELTENKQSQINFLFYLFNFVLFFETGFHFVFLVILALTP